MTSRSHAPREVCRRPSVPRGAAIALAVLVASGCSPSSSGSGQTAGAAVPATAAAPPAMAQRPAVHPDVLRAELAALVESYHSILLTPEQQALKTQALEAIPAPCCSQFSIATCCCPCNLAKAVWGLSHRLIAEGADVSRVRREVESWLARANPDGFAGDACYLPGGCERPVHQDGCGGMHESALTD